MRFWPAVAALAAPALLACGSVGGNAVVPTPISPPTDALAGWATFPFDRQPRPVVMILDIPPKGGFTGNDSKIAAVCHKFKSGTALSKAVPLAANVSWSSGVDGLYPSISAAAALTAMSQAGPTSDPTCATVQPLVVTGARFGRSEFITDRGTAQVDSWLFRMGGLNGDMAYPALTAASVWNADMTKSAPESGSVVSSDGRTLTFSFFGDPATGQCSADYRAVVAESQAAVAIALQKTPHPQQGPPVMCITMAQVRSVDVTLSSVLGGRVVLDATGNVMSACPVEKPAC